MSDHNRSLLQELLAAQDAGEPVVLATVIRARGSVPRHTGAKMLVYADGRISGTVGGGEMESRVVREALAALADGRSRVIPYALVDPEQGDPGVCGGEMEVFVEPYLPPATVLVVGCGHVGQAVAHLAHWLGFRVVVTDDRVKLVDASIIPHADVYLPGSIEDALAAHPVTAHTYVVLVTRNIKVDQTALIHLLQTSAAYIGVMGSRRRWVKTQKLLLADGVAEAALTRIHSPIGLALHAETPEEIAVSVMAEIIRLRRGTGCEEVGR